MRGKLALLLVAALMVAGPFAAGASAAVFGWEFTVHPTQEAIPMQEAKGSSGVETGYGGGQGLLGDGTAEFSDNPNLSGNYGFYYNGLTGPFTMDLRIKVLEDVTNGGGKSISFRDQTGNGRGMQFDLNKIELVSSGNVRTYGPIDFTQWQIVRNSFPGNGTVDTYLWVSGTFVHLGNQGMGGSGYSDLLDSPGIGIGSLAGSSTNSGKFLMDWVFVDDLEARGDRPPPIPEPATLLMAALCGAPLLRRRH